MTSWRSVLAAAAVTLLAFALGFGLRRSASEGIAGKSESEKLNSAHRAEAAAAPVDPRQDLPDDPDALYKLAVERHEAKDLLASAIALYQWLNVADAATIAAVVGAGDESTLPEVLLYTALLRWAELDRDSLIAKLGDEEWIRAAILSADLRINPIAALDSSPPDSPPELLEHCRMYIAARHPEFDPDWARSFGVSLEWFFQIWLQRDLDPAAFFADIDNLDPEVAKMVLSHEMRGRDPDRIAAILEKLGDDPEMLKLAHEAIGENLRGGLSKPLDSLKILQRFGIELGGDGQVPIYHYHTTAMSETPEATTEWLLSLDPEERKGPLRNIFGSSNSGSTNMNGWLDLYERIPREELPNLHGFSRALKTMIDQDPLASLEWFERVKAADHFSEDEHNQSQFLRSAGELGTRFAYGGTESAIETARKIDNRELREAVLAGVLEHAGRLDTESARAVFAELGDELSDSARAASEQKILSQEIHNEFHDSPFDTALERLSAIEDDKVRAEIARSVVYDYQLGFADRAIVLEKFPNSDVINYPAAFSRDWAKKDPEGAADWILQLADHETFPKHIDGLIENWAKQDVNAAGTWLQQIESKPALDAAKAKIATKVSSVEPHTALEWAASISDPEQRAKSLRQAIIAVDTYASEIGEANEAIAELAISEQERAMLLEHLEK